MWICTKDYTEEINGCSRVGTTSPDFDERIFQQYKDADTIEKWRTEDDDGNKIHEGLLAFHDDTSEFDPLDDLSTPDCGATNIYFWREEEKDWELV